MLENKSYIRYLRQGGGNLAMLDAASRKIKAQKIVAVMRDFAGKSGQELSRLSCLDYGCSVGLITGFLAKEFHRVVGVDIDQEAVRIAEKENRAPNVRFLKHIGTRTEFPAGSFDVIVCNHVYEHVADPQVLFDEIYRLLPRGGFCYLSAVNKYSVMEQHHHLPFLSWLPRKLANRYLAAAKGISIYEERPLSYFHLKKMLQKFALTDYTLKVIKEPQKYCSGDMIGENSLWTKVPAALLRIIEPLIPNYIFILAKK